MRIFLVAIAVAGLATPVAAKKPAAGSKSKAQVQAYHPTSCSDALSHIRALRSSNVDLMDREKALGRRFDEVSLDKGEYETTAQNEQRVAATIKRYFGDVDGQVIRAPLQDSAMRYDADKSELTVRLFSHVPYESISNPAPVPIYVYSDSRSMGSRRGVTRMGVKFDYDVVLHYENKVIAMLPANQLPTEEFVLTTPPAQAPSVKRDLFVLAYGSLARPYREHEESDSTPSLDDPTEMIEVNDSYYIVPKCLYIVRASTGEVVHTYIDPSAPPGPVNESGEDALPDEANLRWIKFPDINEYYPKRATDDEVEGSVTVECEIVSAAGNVKCSAVSETPAGYGFGAAAVNAFEKDAKIDMQGVRALGRKIRSTVRFQLG